MGGSIPVPNVQALAASGDMAEIPERYIRPEMEVELVADGGGEEVPVVDLSSLLGDPASHAEEAAKLLSACEDWGFFQVVNHGVPGGLVGSMKAALEEFFDQPLEAKMASSKQAAGSFEGYGQAFVVSEEQRLDWADMLFLGTQPPARRNLHLWPTHPQNFRATLEEYSLEIMRVAELLLRLMAESLGLSPDKFFTGHSIDGSHGMLGVRMNYYPPCPHHADKVLGISPHSDGNTLTVFLQASPVRGLQIKRNGRWLSIDPLPGAFVINIGDVLEIMTNGRFKSIEHRAVVDRERSRLSVAALYGPDVDGFIAPLQDLVGDGKPLFKSLGAQEYYKLHSSTKLQGKRNLECMKISE